MKSLFIFMAAVIVSQNTFSQKLVPGTNTGTNGNLEYLSVATFKQKVFDYSKSKTWSYKGNKPCIIDFYADWCRPCKMIAPIIEEISNDYKDKIYVYKVNTDNEKELSQAFGIQSIPAVLFVPLAGQPQMMVGAHSKAEFEKYINDFLKVKK